jgi:hypothetical protein
VQELSTSSFSPSACAATETLQVRYQAAWLAQIQLSHSPTIVGTASLHAASSLRAFGSRGGRRPRAN